MTNQVMTIQDVMFYRELATHLRGVGGNQIACTLTPHPTNLPAIPEGKDLLWAIAKGCFSFEKCKPFDDYYLSNGELFICFVYEPYTLKIVLNRERTHLTVTDIAGDPDTIIHIEIDNYHQLKEYFHLLDKSSYASTAVLQINNDFHFIDNVKGRESYNVFNPNDIASGIRDELFEKFVNMLTC